MATTWADDATIPGHARAAHASCTTGSESAPADGVAAGMLLRGILGFMVYVKSKATAFTAASLDCYMQNPVTGEWIRRPEWDEPIPAATTYSFSRTIDERTQVSRVAFVPNGLGQGSDIYVVGNYRGQ